MMVNHPHLFVRLAIAAALFTVSFQLTAVAEDAKGEVIKASEEYDDAIRRSDAAAYERILADDFSFTDHEGKVFTKPELVALVKSGEQKFEVARSDDLNVRVYDNCAVVIGRWREKGMLKGETFDRTQRFTTVYVKDGGKWRVVSDHVSEIKKPS
jgi:ketosteroid isomerase-like protein